MARLCQWNVAGGSWVVALGLAAILRKSQTLKAPLSQPDAMRLSVSLFTPKGYRLVDFSIKKGKRGVKKEKDKL